MPGLPWLCTSAGAMVPFPPEEMPDSLMAGVRRFVAWHRRNEKLIVVSMAVAAAVIYAGNTRSKLLFAQMCDYIFFEQRLETVAMPCKVKPCHFVLH